MIKEKCTELDTSLLSALIQAVTWLLVVLGWLVVHRKTLERERRKEHREASQRIVNELREIEQEATAFHRSQQFDGDRAESLMWRVTRAIKSLQRPPLSTLQINISCLSQLRRSITLRNFDASSFSTQQASSEIVKDIRYATDDLIEEIEAARDRKFA